MLLCISAFMSAISGCEGERPDESVVGQALDSREAIERAALLAGGIQEAAGINGFSSAPVEAAAATGRLLAWAASEPCVEADLGDENGVAITLEHCTNVLGFKSIPHASLAVRFERGRSVH